MAYPYQSEDELMQARWAMVARDRAPLYQLTRDELIAMLAWNDGHGESAAEGFASLTLDEARELVAEVLDA